MPDPLVIEFTIPGNPVQQGSKKTVPIRQNGVVTGWRVIETNDADLRPWREKALYCARAAIPLGSHLPLISHGVVVFADMIHERPASHYRTGRRAGELKPDAPYYKATSPDEDKYQRSLGDALQESGLLRNDALIVRWVAQKTYGERAEVRVTVGPPFGRYTTTNPAAAGTVWSSSGVAVELLGPSGNHITDSRLPLPTQESLV